MPEWINNVKALARVVRGGIITPKAQPDSASANAGGTSANARGKQAQAAHVEAIRLQRADASNLRRCIENELGELDDNLALLRQQYQDAKAQGKLAQADLIASHVQSVKQEITLKKNRHAELTEIGRMLHWKETQLATHFIADAFSSNLGKTKEEYAASIAAHTMRRYEQFELAQMIQESEAGLARMNDAGLSELKAELDQMITPTNAPVMHTFMPEASTLPALQAGERGLPTSHALPHSAGAGGKSHAADGKSGDDDATFSAQQQRGMPPLPGKKPD
ncbi:MAG: hypothetical protein RL748_3599 [Pseudomonadota bacterium]|jgi:hypothetical protein